ncbi:hypothetical protein [Gulosibacter sp. ACHW.36C]|uniref:Uncharacterized protein n=1 Tax=Gulosibacter sediminis TaxID=1729695 RepID=A0ABY4MY92_9MICO|nr:hypothetical protein [Gulosibacter sediminis]UQN13963.1 hypothetical protein M3M28_07760 [Gulosibacter sediminis]
MSSSNSPRIWVYFSNVIMDDALDHPPETIELTRRVSVKLELDTPIHKAITSAVESDGTIPLRPKGQILNGSYNLHLVDPMVLGSAPPAKVVPVTFPLYWAIDASDGRARRVSMMREEKNRYLTLRDLLATVQAGFIEGEASHLYLHLPWGVGGGGHEFFDFTNWLLDIGVDLGTGYLVVEPIRRGISALSARVRNSRQDRRARRVAADWEAHNIYYPFQLREFLELKPSWRIDDVSRRLGVSKKTSEQLLRALGYEPNSHGEWLPGFSRRAIRRRKKWIDKEKGH